MMVVKPIHWIKHIPKEIKDLLPFGGKRGGIALPKWLIACVGENNRIFHFRMLTLFKTIKTFGGELAKAKLAACFVDEADQSISHELDKMGVHIHIVKPYHSNLQCLKSRTTMMLWWRWTVILP
ncbi:hypothetical protein [Paenibacillus naphthalenovorans]|uniref:hypothetical protein n=1 Tax=Paenibacillus naphthalenovorans TaxID=162209 RepID=UPI003D2D592A